MKNWMATVAVVFALAAASYVFYVQTLPEPLAAGFLYGNGHIEGTEVRVSAEVPGRVVQSTLVEGETVERDALLVALDSADIEAEIARAQAQMNGIGFEQQRIAAQLATWRDLLVTSQRDATRYQTLRQRGLVAEQQVDQTATVQREALGQVRALEAQLQESAAREEEARQRIALLEIRLAKTRIHSPLHATVLTEGIEPGELAAPGRVVAVLVDLDDLELKVYVPEAVLGKIKLNDAVRVRVNAFPDRYFTARVKRVDQRAQFTPRDINMPEERVRTVFGVVLALDNQERFLKPGMPADAWIRWDAAQAWPDRLVVPR